MNIQEVDSAIHSARLLLRGLNEEDWKKLSLLSGLSMEDTIKARNNIFPERLYGEQTRNNKKD